jgi:hypothetical protein
VNKVFILRNKVNASALWAFLKANWEACSEAGKPLQITITEEKTKRSLDQNRMYWSCLRTISDTGWIHGQQFTSEAWHHYLRLKFLPCLDGPDGLVIPSTTTTLTVDEMTEYINQVQAWAATELGVEFLEVA